jgi:hypothetical protein
MTEMTEPARETGTPSAPKGLSERFSSTRVRVAAGVGTLVVVAGIVVAIVVGGSSSSTPGSAGVNPIAPVALSASGLRTLAKNVPQPIYWAGPQSRKLYELSRTANGNVYIRYLPPDVKAGAKGAKYLIVATYPYPNAFKALQAVANGKGISIPGGGIALVGATDPKSVHLAWPGVRYQVEVFDPSPSTARSVAVSGAVRPVGG